MSMYCHECGKTIEEDSLSLCPKCAAEKPPRRDWHGRVIRCDRYPLLVGDELTLHPCQVSGTIDGYPHTALPGRYEIEAVEHGGNALLLRHLGNGSTFRCGCYELRAILGEWSDYRKLQAVPN